MSYSWDFGDGTTSTDPIVKHTYEKSGEYVVTLTVVNKACDQCNADTTTTRVRVNKPPVAVLSGDDRACVGESLSFDATGSSSKTGVLSYLWNFGDGTTATDQRVSKAYDKAGIYNVVLTVDDGAGTPCSKAIASKTVTINSTPTADAGDDIEMCVAGKQDFRVRLNGARSRSATGEKLNYLWDFGDGTTGQGASVEHVYAKPGEYTATLTVDDGTGSKCSSGSDKVKVKLNRGPIANAGEDKEICLGEDVVLDGSLSQGSDAGRLSYRWDFGDGTTGEGVQVRHTYEKSGRYRAVLTVDDGKGTSCSVSSSVVNVIVNARPAADLKQNRPNICLGERICCFDASASRDPEGNSLTFNWDFGDGRIVNRGPTKIGHQYSQGGRYTATVTVDDGKGTACSTDTASVVTSVNTRPVAVCGQNTSTCVDQPVTFDGSGSSDPDGDTLRYLWDFGDGTTAEGIRVSHAYDKIGTYKVTLKVDDGAGLSCSMAKCSLTVIVNEKPKSIIEVK